MKTAEGSIREIFGGGGIHRAASTGVEGETEITPMHLIDVTMFFNKESGGVKRYLTEKHSWLKSHSGIRHSLLVPVAQRPAWGAVAAPAIVPVGGFPLPFSNGYRCPLLPGRAARALVALKPDIIEAGDPYTLAWSALQAGQQLGVPAVGFYHSDLPRVIGMRFGAGGRRIAEAYVKSLYSEFDLVLAPSNVMVHELHRLGISSARHQALGVDTSNFRPRDDRIDVKARLRLAPTTRLLVNVGRLSREKNLDWLFGAMRLLGPGHHLLIVGGGGDRLKLPENASRLAYVSSSSILARILCACDAFVHAGDKETFGLAVLEAMACGIPVVGMAAGGVAEIVPRCAGVLVEPTGAAALADGIRTLLRSDMQAMGEEARRHVQERYTWKRVFPGLLGHYATIRGQRHVPARSKFRFANAAK